MRQTTGITGLSALCVLVALGGCTAGPDGVSRSPFNALGLGKSDPAPAADAPALDPQTPDGTASEVIGGLLTRRSVLEDGAYTRVADAVLAANARAAEADLRAATLRAEARSKNWLPTLGPQVSLTSLGTVVASLVVEQVIFDNGRKKAERAYAKARAGEEFEMTSRFIDIHAFDLLEIIDSNSARFTVTSGKGAYMRALARDLAIEVGTCGHLSGLRRMSVGPFAEEASISLENLEQLGHSAAASPILLPVETALDGIPALALSEREANMLRNGQAVPILRPQDRERIASAGVDGIVLVLEATTPVALVRVDGIQIRPVRVLNL